MNYKVVSFYTPKYEEPVKILEKSLKYFKIPYKITPKKDTGDWVKNCAMKPGFILEQWGASNVPIVWLDADAVVKKNPYLFIRIDTDMGAHFRCDKRYHNELLSGTLFFNKTDGAKRILEKWVERCEKYEGEWDQIALADVVSRMDDISVYRLPSTYTKIFDTMEGDAVIEHFQHSRAVKKGLI